MKIVVFLLLVILGEVQKINAQSTGVTILQQGFKDPPINARPKALWPWVNGNVSLSQITYEMEEAKRKGMGGFDIWDIGTNIDPNNVVPAGPAFLSDESVQAIAFTILEADRIGLELGLTFSSSWNAGGSWIKPEHGAMGLFRKDTIVNGPINFSSAISFPVIPATYHNQKNLLSVDPKSGLPTYFKEVALIAHPINSDSALGSLNEVIALEGFNVDGKLTWQVPSGKWRIVRYVCAPTGQPLAIPSTNSKGLMLDHFSADAQRANMKYIFDRLLPVTGSLKNRSLKYLYADSYEVNSAVWTPMMAEEFQKRKGYSLLKYLPLLDGFRLSQDTTSRFLFDFRKTLSDLIIENHYVLGKELCEEKGLGFVAEAGGPGQPIHNVPFEDLKALGALTIPRGEFWNKHPQLELLQIVKGIASASHIYNRKFVEAESFTSVWLWQEGPDELKPLADRAMCEGLNRFVYHTFPHTPPESGNPGWVYNFGSLINTTNGWWPKSKGFHEYLSRCSYLLQQGNFVADVAYYYGDDAPNFVTGKEVDSILGFGYDYDVVNTDVLINKMTVRNGKIYLPHGQFYEVLVLPQQLTMNAQVAQKLQELVAAGATVIGPEPLKSNGLNRSSQNDVTVKNVTKSLWGPDKAAGEKKYGKGILVWNKTLKEVLRQKGVAPDLSFKTSGNINSFDFIHRQAGKQHIYFIRNINPEPVTAFLTFRVKGMKPELWNPETGTITPITVYKEVTDGIEIPLSFANHGSVFIIFSSPLSPALIKLDENILNNNIRLLHTNEGIAFTTNGQVTGTRVNKRFTQDINLPAAITLDGPWELRFQQNGHAPARDTFHTLVPLNQSSKDGIKYFSGTVAYHHTFSVTNTQLEKNMRMLLSLGKVKEIAEVYLNGQNLGLLWHTPFQTDITNFIRPGENHLVIELVNTPNNALIGDAKFSRVNRKLQSNIVRLPNAWSKPFAEAPLLDAGLIGPVTINYAILLKQ
ncbi:glycosyl hydrolase [Flavitalea sp.]|nr:glycosyl hydrolase [Flavitalea sp.]